MNPPHDRLAGRLCREPAKDVRPIAPALHDVGAATADDLLQTEQAPDRRPWGMDFQVVYPNSFLLQDRTVPIGPTEADDDMVARGVTRDKPVEHGLGASEAEVMDDVKYFQPRLRPTGSRGRISHGRGGT